MKKAVEIGVVKLANTENGIISVYKIEEPYGEGSKPVVSIGISLSGDKSNPDWKAHIPYENLDQLIELLQKAKSI
jgi:hypothetical protein